MQGRATEPPWLILADKIKEIVDFAYDCRIAKTALSTSVIIECCETNNCVAIRLTDDHIHMQNKSNGPYYLHSLSINGTKIPIAQPNSLELLFNWLRDAGIILDENKVRDVLA